MAASRPIAGTGAGIICPEYWENRTPTAPFRPPVRLTQRGRIVVTGVSALLIGLLTVGLAATAQATRHTGPADPGRYVTRVVVQPGQSLWSLVQASAPDLDPRQAIAQVLELNSLTSDQVQPGQVLWLPKG